MRNVGLDIGMRKWPSASTRSSLAARQSAPVLRIDEHEVWQRPEVAVAKVRAALQSAS